ncbi:hypothetical protein PRIC2_010137 [Phytophthora ramorum]
MLSRVPPGELQPSKHNAQGVEYPVATAIGENSLHRRHSTCGLTSVSSELEVTTRATVAGYPPQPRGGDSYGELPILRYQYVARGVCVLFGSRWRLNRFQERTIVLRTGVEPSIAVYTGAGDAASFAETTYVLPLDTTCDLIDGRGVSNDVKVPRSTCIQLLIPAKTSGSSSNRLRIRFATAADANIWCSIIRETLRHAKWSRDTRPTKESNSTPGRSIRVVQHAPSSKRFVVKVLTTNPNSFERGDCRELHILRRLYSSWFAQDVSLVHGYRVVETPQELLLIMPQFPGSTLLQVLRQRRRRKQTLKDDEAWRFVDQLATLLQAAHQTGIVHCDLNLENVLITSDFTRTWLIDFGGAFDLLAGQNSTCQTQRMTGTPGYVAPERVQNPLIPPTPKADVFSLGVLLFQALSGQHPYLDAASEKRLLQLQDSLRLDWARAEALLEAESVSPELRQLISAMLATDPCARISLDEVLVITREALVARFGGL